MTTDQLPVDLKSLDFTRLVADRDAIRAVNPQRHEFEMLSGIVYLDPTTHTVVGYKDVTADEFWVRGHMPGYPLFPGVLMCEAAAQLCAYYYTTHIIGEPGVLLGLAGLDEARFVRTVRPGDRLVLVGVGLKIHRRLTRFRVTGFVGGDKCFEATVSGTPIGKLEDLRGA